MQKTHDFRSLFVQFLEIVPDTPLMHWVVSQEVTAPFRKAKGLAVRIPWVKVTFDHVVVLGFWRKTGYEEHEALARALNMNEDHANDQVTDYETAAAGLKNTSTKLGLQAQPFTGGRAADQFKFGADGQ